MNHIMSDSSRRGFLTGAGAVAALAGTTEARGETPAPYGNGAVPLDGAWLFRTDPQGRGELEGWHLAGNVTRGWSEVAVPHTWQVRPETAGYQGAAWYRRVFEAPAAWAAKAVRVEFEAVFHTATVWVNGRRVGQHTGKGYTAFECDINAALRPGANVIVVRADNSPNKDMLPRELSYDWTQDGGIIRPVRLLVTPPVYIERVDVDAVPDLAMRQARLNVRVVVRNRGSAPAQVRVGYGVTEDPGGALALRRPAGAPVSVPAGGMREVALTDTLANARLWHFDHPYLYRLAASIDGHDYETTFGVRSFEARGDGFYLNGERVLSDGRGAHGRQQPGVRHGRAARVDRARPRRHEGAELRLHARALAAGPPRARLLRPQRHPDPGGSARVGSEDLQGHEGPAGRRRSWRTASSSCGR